MKRLLAASIAAAAMLVCVLPGAAQYTEPTELSTAAMSHESFRITPAAKHITRQLLIDQNGSVTVAVSSPSKTLSVSLISPGGVTYHVGDPATPQFESAVTPDPTLSATNGANYIASLTAPAVGLWTLDIIESAAITAPVDGVCMLLFDNDTRALMLGGGETYFAGAKTRLAAVAFDGAAKLRGLTITARIFDVNDPSTPTAVIFTDDGAGADSTADDGIYNAFVQPTGRGEYQVAATIDGTASTGAFRRTTSATFRTVARRVALDGTFADRAFDRDGDGQFDEIRVAARGSILEAGTYMTTIRLSSANGNVMQRSATADLSVGSALPEVAFPVKEMQAELTADGPYNVDVVTVEVVAPADLMLADRRYALGPTQAWRLTDFQHPLLRLTGAGTAQGFDFNGNALYDQLQVTVGVASDLTGYFQYSGSLLDAAGHEIAFRSGDVFLQQGDNSVPLNFDGRTIGESGIDGPYVVGNFLMYGSGQSIVADRVFTTQMLRAVEFEGGAARDTTPPQIAVTVTPTTLSVNHKMVEITPVITVSDNVDLHPVVTLSSIMSNEGQNVRGDGNTATDISIDATGRIFLRADAPA